MDAMPCWTFGRRKTQGFPLLASFRLRHGDGRYLDACRVFGVPFLHIKYSQLWDWVARPSKPHLKRSTVLLQSGVIATHLVMPS